MKYKTTTVQTAKEEHLVKKGDYIWVKVKVLESDEKNIKIKRPEFMGELSSKTKIKIPIPKKKPINFGEAGRILTRRDFVICTTGLENAIYFSAYVLQSKSATYPKGSACDDWIKTSDWVDITNTYKP